MSLNCSFRFLNWSGSRLFTSLSRLLDINLKQSIKRILYLNFLFSSLTLFEKHIFLLIVWDTINLTLCFPKILDEEMCVTTWKVMKYHWHMLRFCEKQVTFNMSRSSQLPGKVTMISHLIIITFKRFLANQHSLAFSNFARSSSEKIISFTSDDQTRSISFSSMSTKMSATFSSSLVFVNKIGSEDLSRHFTWKQNPDGSCFW